MPYVWTGFFNFSLRHRKFSTHYFLSLFRNFALAMGLKSQLFFSPLLMMDFHNRKLLLWCFPSGLLLSPSLSQAPSPFNLWGVTTERFQSKVVFDCSAPKASQQISFSYPERWQRSENFKAMFSLFYSLVIFSAIAVLPLYCLYVFCSSQLNNVFAVAFILSDVLLIKKKIKQKNWLAHYSICAYVCV